MVGLPLIGSSLHGFVVYSHTVLSADEQAITEAKVKAACEAAQFQDATTLAIQCYGPEIFGYLVAVTRNQMDADDAFGIFCESVWTNLSGFQWRSSLRTWLYSVARSALGRVLRDPHRKRERGIPLSQAGAGELAEHVRTATKEYLLSSARDRLESIKQKLSAEDHTLLILRVNRNMAWNEIAVIVSDGAELSDEEIKRKAASLRKRFERTKEQLRQLIRQDTAEPE